MPTYNVQWNLLNAVEPEWRHKDYGLVIADTKDDAIDIIARREGLTNVHLMQNLDAYEVPPTIIPQTVTL